ncbi:hypothetical protein KTO58_08975 [Chitinophaga pendula]|uniref:SpvB/TcaC N-terminal domain-containing protein n=1 Tax=Chitinophaga TaxID=79328 RepID=UPI000BB09902|nr:MULTISPECIES: SpvB/TcaC N-terminal domain-containing protein [Chitinophaga]ASZ13078.1 hypothetical protein CK934_19995 [Chitinophaga sp. MD30]UCJ09301.1 hypothetical protein KTO58_08975 [Chitinophaga pendula]
MKRYHLSVSVVLTLSILLAVIGISRSSLPLVSARSGKRVDSVSKTTVSGVRPPVSHMLSYAQYPADLPAGLIGVTAAVPVDDPTDNLFHISLPGKIDPDVTAYLTYELYGVAGNEGVARSINEGVAVGGQFVDIHHSWTTQTEAIPISALKAGDNIIRFGLPVHADFYYRVRHVAILLKQAVAPAVTIKTALRYSGTNKVYIRGMLATGYPHAPAEVLCNGYAANLSGDEFEVVLPAEAGVGTVALKAIFTDGRTVSKQVVLTDHLSSTVTYIPAGGKALKASVATHVGQASQVLLPTGAGIRIPGGVLSEDRIVTVSTLRDVDIVAMNVDLVNVTGGAAAYRFSPHATRMNGYALVSLPYDSALIPEGYTPEDIRTYYFDEVARTWKMLAPDSLMTEGQVLQSVTPYFSDMINGIIKVPESPEGRAYVPTSIKDIQAASPGSGISMMAPPTPNMQGNASMGFPIRLPAGRQGMQPSLGLYYNSDGDNGWLGMGWGMSVPSIGIETRWGVPRYDVNLETETYTMGGAQLAPLAHRAAFVKRTAEKQFYPRVEGSFMKIIRHGDHPRNYWWEVTDKRGIRSFYGGRPGKGVDQSAVLQDATGNIAYWPLVMTVDLHNNTVIYQYELVRDPGVAGGTVPGQQLYVSQISYTGTGDRPGAYQVAFVRDRQLGGGRRKDVVISGRLGFKMVTADLLKQIQVRYLNQPVRSYTLQYTEGAFNKTLLKSIAESDADGVVFNTHTLDYYNDVYSNGVFRPFGNVENWQVGDDQVTGDISNPVPGYGNESSLLGTSKAKNSSKSLALTMGIWDGNWSKSMTVGGSTGSGTTKTEGLTLLYDINGDGLPDKVFRSGGQLWYRKNLGSTGRGFGDRRRISGITQFHVTNTKSSSRGYEVNVRVAFWGNNKTQTTTTTTDYLADFNGDGLPDLASNGQVYFNRVDAQGDPVFLPGSGGTSNPVTAGSNVSPLFLAPDTDLQAQQEREFPLQDIVRCWQAPRDGVVAVSGAIQLLSPVSGSNKQDGVRVSVQRGGQVLWATVIAANDQTPKIPAAVDHITISKGERIYFRMQSVYNGEDDLINWDPVVQYVTPVVPATDANGRSTMRYQASEDFVLHDSNGMQFSKAGTINIDGLFKKGIVSDSVRVVIRQERGGVSTIVVQQVFAGPTALQQPIQVAGLSVQPDDRLRFELLSDSYIDRSRLQWAPHYTYTIFTDGTPATQANGQPVIAGDIVPRNDNFNDWFSPTPVLANVPPDAVVIHPFIENIASANGQITFTIKRNGLLVGKTSFGAVGGNIQGAADIPVDGTVPGAIYCEYSTNDRVLAKALSRPRYVLIRDSTYTDLTGNMVTVTLRDTLEAGLFTQPKEDFLGTQYRGWGHFSYKGTTHGTAPLDESKINVQGFANYSQNPDVFADSSLFNQIIDAFQADFIPLYAAQQKGVWVGFDSSVYVSATQMSSARLWMHDVAVDSLMSGGNVKVVNKISRTQTRSTALGLSLSDDYTGIGGSISRTTSETGTTNDLDMQDMNGDRHPDVLRNNDIQFTLPTGGLSAGTTRHGLGAATFKGELKGHSLGGSGTLPNAFSKQTPAAVASAQAHNAAGTIGISVTGSGSLAENKNETVSNWMDINGDGLPDKLYQSGAVSLNLGYGFSAAEYWGSARIEEGETKEKGIGPGVGLGPIKGFSRVNGSFQAGSSVQRSEGASNTSYADVNGDGLPDKLFLSGNQVAVQFNSGGGFASAINWNGLTEISKQTSTSESFNAAVTVVIPVYLIFVTLKFCINPGYADGNSVSREQYQLADIDGDGYADILRSIDDGNLSVQRAMIGRTNLLRAVSRPMGSSFYLDYERTVNTYDMPHSKWVLQSVTLADGVSGDGADTTRSRYTYSGGYYDRREREFYGFKQVTAHQLNTETGNSIYRTSVQEYLNKSYYSKGLPVKEWLQDANGTTIYTQTANTYDLRPVVDSSQFPALVRMDKLFNEAGAGSGLSTYSLYDYDLAGNVTMITDIGDGSQNDYLRAQVSYHNDDVRYIKSVASRIDLQTPAGLLRRRSTVMNAQGDVTRIQTYSSEDAASVYDLEYDEYGNLSRLTRPKNHKGERLWYCYTYDAAVHTYPIQVRDAYGYSSSSTYDYRFGSLLNSTSINETSIRYEIDAKGRIVRITGPYELAANRPYTIAFEYHPEAKVPYALTRHLDPEYQSDIRTISFTDGLGRSLQIKKEAAIFKARHQPDDVKMIVSGHHIYDAFGRVTSTYYPTTAKIDAAADIVLSNTIGKLAVSNRYDIQDRPLQTVFADGATDSYLYTISNGYFSSRITDALRNQREVLTDVKGRKRQESIAGAPGGGITTRYHYNALGALLQVMDAGNNVTSYTYDLLGRKTSMQHPDAGLTVLEYDAASNLIARITPQIRKEIPTGGAVKYYYDHERVTDIDYPRQYQNKVRYAYGAPGTGNRAGRLTLQIDASGGQEYYYGKLGEITKTIRTMSVSNVFFTTYVSEATYDTWNRIKQLTYPDGEVVTYRYNKGGSLFSVSGSKAGHDYPYVKQLGYNEFEQRVYLQYGNGTENKYTYEPDRHRLSTLNAVAAGGRVFMNQQYRYDPVGNVLSIRDDAPAQGAIPGGSIVHQYTYDNLYRLTAGEGMYRGINDTASYKLQVGYDNLYNITSKDMVMSGKDKSYRQDYRYSGTVPHQAIRIGAADYLYDLNGNLTTSGKRQYFWDEENRLMAVKDGGILSQYTYDATGERAVKSSGGYRGSWVNGAPAGVVVHDTNYIAYVSPYIVTRRTGFTKHYYIEGQRIASKVGIGRFTNISFPKPALTAGGINYQERNAQLQRDRYAYYASLAVSPGPPTDKYFYALPYNNGIAAPITYDTTRNSVPRGWPGNTTPAPGGPPVSVSPIPSNDSVKAGYGFVGTGHFYEQQQYYFHPDHLGSTNYLTNVFGEVAQYNAYTPYGELFVDKHKNDALTPYLFNGKEQDNETGNYYYGARYYDPKASLWLSVDPETAKFANLSPYNYTLNNPVKLIDPNGAAPVYSSTGTFMGITDNGLQGKALIMNQQDFTQGMSHSSGLASNLGPEGLQKYAIPTFMYNYNKLKDRPDWDGFVGMQEGIDWAKAHPNLDNDGNESNGMGLAIPEDWLYVDASKLDFGILGTNSLTQGKRTSVNLLNYTLEEMMIAGLFIEDPLIAAILAPSYSSLATTYALGRTEITLLDKQGHVRVENGPHNIYNWDRGGNALRKFLIDVNRGISGLDDSHGFPLFIYGTGKLNTW